MVFCKTELTAAVAADQVLVGTNVKFERIRRITGYLVGTLDRWNDGKKAEEHDRVKHNVDCGCVPSNTEGVYTVEEKDKREVEKMYADRALGKE